MTGALPSRFDEWKLVSMRDAPDFTLLEMAEGVIAAHKAAVRDGDHEALELLEALLRHVGQRMTRELSSVAVWSGGAEAWSSNRKDGTKKPADS